MDMVVKFFVRALSSTPLYKFLDTPLLSMCILTLITCVIARWARGWRIATYTHSHIHIYIHTCIQTYIHTYTSTAIFSYKWLGWDLLRLAQSTSFWALQFSLVPRPSYVFQCFMQKIGKAWLIMWCNDDVWTLSVTQFENLCPLAHANVLTLICYLPSEQLGRWGREAARWLSAINAMHPECTWYNHFISHGFNYYGYAENTRRRETSLSCLKWSCKATLWVSPWAISIKLQIISWSRGVVKSTQQSTTFIRIDWSVDDTTPPRNFHSVLLLPPFLPYVPLMDFYRFATGLASSLILILAWSVLRLAYYDFADSAISLGVSVIQHIFYLVTPQQRDINIYYTPLG